MSSKKIAIVMGSDSDWPIMQQAADFIGAMQIEYEAKVVSAHRTPEYMFEFAKNSHQNYDVIIAGAGGAAHLPGMIASLTHLPVIGVPIKSSNSIDGWDSLLSILQMPNGIPVATVALNGAKNAGILAVSILSTNSKVLEKKIAAFKVKMRKEVEKKVKTIKGKGYDNAFDK
jgi:5-(carboxyamino)imidazole ribonucleotide mutase